MPEAEDEQAAPAPAAVMLLPAPAAGGGESSGVAGEGAPPRWQRPDPPARAKLIKSSSTSTSDVEAHDRSAQLAFALSLARDAFLDARPGAVWDNEHPAFQHEDPLQGFFRLILRIFEDGLHEDEVVLERKTEGRISGLVVYKSAGRNGEAMLQLLGFPPEPGSANISTSNSCATCGGATPRRLRCGSRSLHASRSCRGGMRSTSGKEMDDRAVSCS